MAVGENEISNYNKKKQWGLWNTPTNLCIALSSHYITEQKHNNKEWSKTMRNLTKLCINLLEYATSMKTINTTVKQNTEIHRLQFEEQLNKELLKFFYHNNLKISICFSCQLRLSSLSTLQVPVVCSTNLQHVT